jgi:hypothetical protein
MESAYLLERATARARRQLDALSAPLHTTSGTAPQGGSLAEPVTQRLLSGFFSRRS